MDARNESTMAAEPEQVSQEIVQSILEQVDRESSVRHLTGRWPRLISVLAVALSVLELYVAVFGRLPAQIHRSLFLGFSATMIFLLYPWSPKKRTRPIAVYDVLLALVGGAMSLYWAVFYDEMVFRPAEPTIPDLIVGAIAILVTLEIARRTAGLPIVIIAGAFLLYARYGSLLPGFLSHRGFSLERIIDHMYLTAEGIIGIPLGVCADFVFLFVLFGAFLEKTGVSRFFVDLSNAIAGASAAGPAKVAVVTSALEGTISGSSVANTVGSGSVTIPLMKRLGYRPEFAGAVEAAASTGGQIMPPIMGAAAFLMAEFLGIPYTRIALSAAIPAVLYFTGVFFGVEFEGRRLGLKGLPKEQIPKLANVLKERGYLFLPVVSIVVTLIAGYTPTKAALTGILMSILVSCFKRETRLTLRDIIACLETGGRNALGMAAVAACAGIVIGVITLTGLGLKMANGLVDLAGGSLVLTMVFAMIASLILGMGTPTTANYVITSTIAAPALIKLGVKPLAAHLFVFYFGILADLTPPVAVAAYAGAGIAGADPARTGVIATKLAIGAWIVPYVFALSPQLLLLDATLLSALRLVVGSVLGMVAVASGVAGWFSTSLGWWERACLLIGGCMLIAPSLETDIAGLILAGLAWWSQNVRARRRLSSAAG